MNCNFKCDGVICATNTTTSFKHVICNTHLSEVYGFKQWIFKSQVETNTGFGGPYLMPDDFMSFKPNTVVLPTKQFLDSFLMPEKFGNSDSYQYQLNPRMQTYYNNLNMNRMKFQKNTKSARYHFELIRNLGEKDSKNISTINDHDLAQVELKKHLQDRITKMNHWIESEPYYQNFKSIQIMTINDPTKLIPLTDFSPFYGFLIFNTFIDKHFLPGLDKAPLMLYANLAYKENVGFVTINEVVNNVPFVTLGEMKASYAYYQHKTHLEPNHILKQAFNKDLFPDNMRNLNVISSNDRYC